MTDWLTAQAGIQDKAVVAGGTLATPIGLVNAEARLDKTGDYRAAWLYNSTDNGFGVEYSVLDSLDRFNANYNRTLGFGSLGLRYSSSDNWSNSTAGAQVSAGLPMGFSVFGGVDVDTHTLNTGYNLGVVKMFTPRLTAQVGYTRGADNSDMIMGQLSFSLDRSKPSSVGGRAGTSMMNGEATGSAMVEGRYGLYGNVTTNVSKNATTSTATIAGSVGCVDGLCRVGEPVSGAFVVGDGLDTNSIKGSLISVPAYQNLNVSSSTRKRIETMNVALRPGQGVKLSVNDWVTVRAKVYWPDGTPVAGEKVTYPGGETVTGTDGLLYITKLPKKLTVVEVAGKKVMLQLSDTADNKINMGRLTIGKEEYKTASNNPRTQVAYNPNSSLKGGESND